MIYKVFLGHFRSNFFTLPNVEKTGISIEFFSKP